MDNSIITYYGLSRRTGVTLQSFQFDYINQIQDSTHFLAPIFEQKDNTVVLFISLRTTTISDRIMPLPIMFKQKFGFSCELLFEHHIRMFEGVKHICAVTVSCSQVTNLLETLFNYSTCSFAVLFKKRESLRFLERVIYLFEDGVLTPKVIKSCLNATLNENASFLHVLRGNDGYSINLFSGQGDCSKTPRHHKTD